MRAKQWAVVVFTGVLMTSTAAFGQATWPDLSEPADEQGGGDKDAVLIVGVEDYVFAPDIKGAIGNANDWYTYFTRTRKVPVGNVFLLRDNEGTRETMLEKATEVAGRVGRGGTLWFVYIGHGAPGKDGKDGVLVGADAQQSASSLYARSVATRELLAAFDKGKQTRTVAVIDACFSGKNASGDVLVAGLQPLLPVAGENTDAIVLTAGASDQFAGPLPGADRPAFSYLALGALRGWGDADGNGEVSAREVGDYARDALRVLLRDRSQTPLTSGRDLDGALVKGATEAGPDLAGFVLTDHGKDGVVDPGTVNGPPAGGTVTGTARPDAHGLGLGLVRVSMGVSRYGSETLQGTTGDTTVNHSSNTIFTDFPLDLTGVTELAVPYGLDANVSLGQKGFTWGGGLGLAWASDPQIAVKVSTKQDSFSETVTQLVAGVDGTITSYFRLNASTDVGYRLVFGALGLYAQAGVGVGLTFIDVEFLLDNLDNKVSAILPELMIPLRTGADFEIIDGLFLHADYTFYALPTASDSFGGGLGVFF